MNCPFCGTSNPGSASSCRYCGEHLQPVEPPPKVPDYLGWAIASTIVGFWPAGIIAIVSASKANSLKAAGNYEDAIKTAKKAKIWCWVTFGPVLLLCSLAALAVAIGGGK